VFDYVSKEKDGEWDTWRIVRSEADKAAAKQGKLPWVVFDGRPAVLILTTQLTLHVPGHGYLKAGEDVMFRVVELANDPDLVRLGVKKSMEPWALLEAHVSYPEGNPIDKLAPVLAEVLSKLDDVREARTSTTKARAR